MNAEPSRNPRGPEEHKAAVRELGLRNVRELLALAPDNDPFYKGTAAHLRAAEWFADLWQRFGYTRGIHLRRAHYQVLSTGSLTSHGLPYENTETCWTGLCNAAASARILGLVDAEAFVDRRNPDPVINRQPRSEPVEPSWSWGWERWRPDWSLPTIGTLWMPTIDRWKLQAFDPWSVQWDDRPTVPTRPDGLVAGYDYDDDDQPVLLEVWVEKSTMEDILGPLCRGLNVNLVTGVGNQSITAAVSLLRRAERHDKPAHVLYVSDFDPAGEHMPTAVARQAQFWRDQLKVEVPITLDPLVLTRDQVAEYRLPRVPIKETDKRAAGFEARNGTGAVELDALEALHPGVLARLVRRAAEPYTDRSLRSALHRAERAARDAVDTQWEDGTAAVCTNLDDLAAEVDTIRERYQDELDLLASELVDVQKPFRERLDGLGAELREAQAPIRERVEALAAELLADLAPYQDRLDGLAERARRLVDDFDPELPERPEPAEPDVDREALLYDSGRGWRDQLAAYRRAKTHAPPDGAP